MYDFRAFSFGRGKHATRDDGMCVMEAVAYLGNERHSDCPKCASGVIGNLAIWLNDSLDDKRRREWLAGLPYRLVGTAATPEIEQQRAFMAADWAVRVVCPVILDRAGLKSEAKKLRELPAVDSETSALASADAARAAYAAYASTGAARAAAYASAYASAGAAARASAYALADAAARAAAGAAARASAYALADAAARAAGDSEVIQRSGLDLIDRMIRLTEIQEVVPQRRGCVVG